MSPDKRTLERKARFVRALRRAAARESVGIARIERVGCVLYGACLRNGRWIYGYKPQKIPTIRIYYDPSVSPVYVRKQIKNFHDIRKVLNNWQRN